MKAIVGWIASCRWTLLFGVWALIVGSSSATAADFAPAIEHSRAVATEVLSQDETPGMALGVAIGQELVWAEGFGFADRDAEIPATATTRFGLGSVTKTLTMVLCARLVQAGHLDWDTPVENYLPDFPHEGKGITVRLIGAHLSGMGDDWATGLRYTMEHFTTDEAYAKVVEQRLVHKPACEHLYGTGTFTVIAAVIEKITGEDFDTVMRAWVLDPLGMKSTVVLDPRETRPERTRFYDPQHDPVKPVVFDPSYKLAGAGYISTAEDMLRFGSSFFDDAFLGPDLRQELFRDATNRIGQPTGFGLGWRITEDEGQPVYYQPGGGPGISSYLVLYPEQELVFVALGNHTSAPTGGRMMGETLEAFLAAISSPGSPPR